MICKWLIMITQSNNASVLTNKIFRKIRAIFALQQGNIYNAERNRLNTDNFSFLLLFIFNKRHRQIFL